MKAAWCLLLAGCIGAPDYYEVTPYYGTMDLGQRDVDAVTNGLLFTLGWSPGVASHNERMEDYAVAALVANPDVDHEWLQETVEADFSDITDKPDTLADVTVWIIWVVGLCLLLITTKQVGILERFFPNKNKE